MVEAACRECAGSSRMSDYMQGEAIDRSVFGGNALMSITVTAIDGELTGTFTVYKADDSVHF